MRHHTFTQTHSLVSALLLNFLALLVLLGCSTIANAQDDQMQIMPARGFHPTHSYAMNDIETISTTSGNLMLDIPLASLPAGRGGHQGFQLKVGYNSKIWDGNVDKLENPDHAGQFIDVTLLVQSKEGGWRYNIPKNFYWAIDKRTDHGQVFPPSDLRSTHIYKFKLMFPDGSSREMRPYNYDDAWDDGYFAVQPAAGMSYFSTDGSFLRLDIGAPGAWTLSFPDGSKVVNVSPGVQRTYDRHGVYIETQAVTDYNGTGHKADIISDQLGRSLVVEYGTNEDYIRATGVGGGAIVTTVKWTTTNVSKVYRAGNHFQYNLTLSRPLKVVSEIDLPPALGTDLKYSFGYNGWPSTGMGTSVGWGELNSLTLPSGANTTYQYNMDNKSGTGWQANMVLANWPTRKEVNYSLEYDGVTTAAAPEIWLYNIGSSGAMITAPDGGITQEFFSPVPTLGRVYKTRRPDGSLTERIWKENRPFSPAGVSLPQFAVINPFVEDEFTSITDANGVLVLTSIKHYSYDKNGNVTQVKDYDWVPYGDVPRDTLGKPTGIPASAQVKRVTTTTYHCDTPGALNTTTSDPDAYDQPTGRQLRTASKSIEVGNGSQVLSRVEYTYDDPFTTGNLTEQRSWDSSKGPLKPAPTILDPTNSFAVTTQYNPYGSPTLTIDQRGTRTLLTYGDVGGGVDNLYPTQQEIAEQTTIKRTEQRSYDFNTGLLISVKDVDNDVTNTTTYDVFGRVTLVRSAVGRDEESRVATEYSAVERRVITRSDLDEKGDGKLVSVKHFDQLGRLRLSRELEDPTEDPLLETDGIKVQIRYVFASGSTYKLSSNPFRAATVTAAGSESTMGWTRGKSDILGRVVEVQTFSGSTLPAPWDTNTSGTGTVTNLYDGNFTTVTNQSGKVRRTKIDGLGRLIRVDEPSDANNTLGSAVLPTQATLYDYDALNNLKTITQGGQQRSFNYTSLSRLAEAFSLESGTTSYTYDDVGNIKTKSDARLLPNSSTHRTITYNYDALGRPTSQTYNDGTPNITYTYDAANIPFSKGRITSISSSVSTDTYLAYDAVGRVKSAKQTIDGQDYTTEYVYNCAGETVSEKYPSGRIVLTNYGSNGRVAGVQNGFTQAYYAGGAASDATNRMQYFPTGSLRVMKMGNNLWEHTEMNSRLQLIQIGVGTTSSDSSKLRLDYGYGVLIGGNLDTSKNDGSPQSQTITVPNAAAIVQTYEYDELDRLKRAQESGAAGWTQQFSYDRFGNRTGVTITDNQNAKLPTLAPEIDPANNRIKLTNPQGQSTGYGYDEAGNVTQEPETGGTFKKYFYDAENRLIQAKRQSGAVETDISAYQYDAAGHRVKSIVNGVTTIYIHDLGGKLIAEYGAPTAGSTGTTYVTVDVLSSTRLATASNQDVKERHDYLPYGEEIPTAYSSRTNVTGYGVNKLRQKFTSKERDDETGLDYFLSRYNCSTQGRFTSPDPYNIILEKEKGQNENERNRMLLSYISQPQIWNKYSYTLNNPLKHTDPDGRRALTKEDEARLKKLLEFAAKIAQEDGNSELVGQVQDAVAEIRAAIAAVPENTHDGLGPNDPAALRAVFWAIDNLGNTNYGGRGTVDNGTTKALGPGDNKCSLFVANAYALGAQTGFGAGGVPTNTTFWGNTYPTVANDLANPAKTVPNFPVTNSPRVGNIAAFPASVGQGHAGLNLGGNVVIYASNVKVKVETVKYVQADVNPSHPTVVYREFKP